MGVLADLSGQPKEALPKLKDRKFVEIDRDNFDDVLKRMKPRLALRVDNTLKGDGSELAVELNFQKLADFRPENVVRQVEPLNKLLEMRNQLKDLLGRIEGNDRLEELLGAITDNERRARASCATCSARKRGRRRDRGRAESWLRKEQAKKVKVEELETLEAGDLLGADDRHGHQAARRQRRASARRI